MEKNKLTLTGKTRKINPDMIGLFFEDINFAADGGLYAEMLENRSFEAVKSMGEPHNYVLTGDPLYGWASLNGKAEKLEISINSPVSEKNPHYLRFTADNAGEGFSNKAYDGITLKKGQVYDISFYAREVSYLDGDIDISINKDGKSYGQTSIAFIPAQKEEPDPMQRMLGNCEAKVWKKYTAALTAEDDVRGGSFDICLSRPGCVEFDLISMIPSDAVAGVFRKDLFDALSDLHPGFVRFPGGCIVEGTSLMRRYQWKNTVGPIEGRKIMTNLWGEQGGNTFKGWVTDDCHYMQSYGIGFYEYFILCELLSSDLRKCRPLPVINIGVACQFRSFETVDIDSDEFNQYVQDALDLIEFANGSPDTKWGSLRAQMGHPESFNLDMIAIGNEQWESRHVDLYERYRRFEKAIHDVYPDMKCLGTAGPFVNHDLHTSAWNFYRGEAEKNPASVYAVDEHYYVKPQWLYDNVDFYDGYPRNVGVFAGEYAGHDANNSNSMEAGLSEAAMITGMERNGDVVKLASYAPLFNRIGHSQWTPDMIWFDDKDITLTPSYYVQKIFSDYAGDQAIELDGQEKILRENRLYVSLVRASDKCILKVVNASESDQSLALTDKDGKPLNTKAEIALLSAESGQPRVNEKTAAIGNSGFEVSVPVGSMTNRKLCELRVPEACTYTVKAIDIAGSIEIPAGSFAAIKW